MHILCIYLDNYNEMILVFCHVLFSKSDDKNF